MIYTTANRVKAAGFWCEDADVQTQTALDKGGHTWDTPLSIEWGLENLGLANSVLALNPDAVIPKHKKDAEIVVQKYLLYLVDLAADMALRLGYTPDLIKVTKATVANPKTRRKGLANCYKSWTEHKEKYVHGPHAEIAEVMAMLCFDAVLPHVRCIHAGKLILQIYAAEAGERDLLSEMKAKVLELCQI